MHGQSDAFDLYILDGEGRTDEGAYWPKVRHVDNVELGRRICTLDRGGEIPAQDVVPHKALQASGYPVPTSRPGFHKCQCNRVARPRPGRRFITEEVIKRIVRTLLDDLLIDGLAAADRSENVEFQNQDLLPQPVM